MFKIIFKNLVGEKKAVDYELIETTFTERWFKKLKSIYKIPIDPNDSEVSFDQTPRTPIEIAYRNFCELMGVEYKKLDLKDQKNLNYLHQLFEQNCNKVIDDRIYDFHRAIHHAEGNNDEMMPQTGIISIGWGVKEGPLMSKYNCQRFYTPDAVQAGDLYLAWSELGKLPSRYFGDGEPNNQSRFNTLATPNKTLRAKFKIHRISKDYVPFPKDFSAWFETYKQSWLDHYDLDDWQPHDEQGGVHLAKIKKKDPQKFFSEYPIFDHIEISH